MGKLIMTDKLRKLGKDKRDEVFSGKKTSGFTIIEVALVLAIAALIFLVVFLAVPALQKNQRDDARKRDVSNIVAAVTTYQANTGKQVPAGQPYANGSAVTGDLGDYLDKMSNNIDYINVITYNSQTLSPAQTASNTDSAKSTDGVQLNVAVVYAGAQCVGNTNIQKANKRMSAVVVQIENGGAGKYYCQDAS